MDEHDKTIKNINGSQVISGSDVDIETNAVVSVIQNITKQFLRKSKTKGNRYYTPYHGLTVL